MSENKKVEIYESNLNAAYQVANENGGDERMIRLLDALTGKTTAKTYKPSLDDYTTIKTYEDACEALGIEPNFNRDKLVFAEEDLEDLERVPKHIIALMKLETISYALWGSCATPLPLQQSWWCLEVFSPLNRLSLCSSFSQSFWGNGWAGECLPERLSL